jgi:hypothetical protein
MNVADSTLALLNAATWHARAGQVVEARQALASFDKLWPAGQLPDYLRKLRPVLPASN